ncbi:hypothetical protein KAZ92_03390 [Candidatus Gracilibacteria bacterium]|nr:hypothetical protein [Candidatus Gracilibacteria bacterium]
MTPKNALALREDIATPALLSPTASNEAYAQWTNKGMIVERVVARRKGSRIVEPLSERMVEVMDFLEEIYAAEGIPASEVMLTELVDGFIMEIPGIQRKVVIRDETFVVIGTVSARSGWLGDEEWRDVLSEAILFDIGDSDMVRNSVIPVDMNAYQNAKIHTMWRQCEMNKRSSREVQSDAEKSEQRIGALIQVVRDTFRAADICYAELDEAKDMRVNEMSLNDIGLMLGLPSVTGSDLELLKFAMCVYGADNLVVKRVYERLLKDAKKGTGSSKKG